MTFNKNVLDIDPAAETSRIVRSLQQRVRHAMRRHGGVIGISGGVDSAVVLALAVRAFSARDVIAVMMPDKDSSPESETLARELARQLGVEPILEDMTPTLEGFGCYCRRDEAIRRVFPEYDAAAGYKAKIVLPQNLLDDDALNVFSLTVLTPDGQKRTQILSPRELLQIVAASNFKQRSRMAMLYYHAELRNYAVIGTANKNEHDQGFFVKHGDAGVDIKAIGHLYKTQIYQLAGYLNIPEEIRRRAPTSDTYSAPCTQQEFFFRLSFATMDLLHYAWDHQVPRPEVAKIMELTEVQVERAFNDFSRKFRTTAYLRMAPLDTTPPTVAITSPTSSATYSTGSPLLTLGGTASDNVGVTQVTWVNSRGGSGTATGTTSWTASGIVLLVGTNVLTVTARDAAGNSGTATLTVTLNERSNAGVENR